jgi:hypothetical protein
MAATRASVPKEREGSSTPTKKRAFTSRAYRIDASTIVFITPMLVLLVTQSLRSHALYLFTEYVDLVVEQRVLRLLCIAGT